MPSNSAAYMRDYRARRRALDVALERSDPDQASRIVELEAEVARLKRLLAARPTAGFNTQPFTPVPKVRSR